MAGGRVTPRRRKPLRATMKGPPPRVRDPRTPGCKLSLDQIDWIEGVPVARCRACAERSDAQPQEVCDRVLRHVDSQMRLAVALLPWARRRRRIISVALAYRRPRRIVDAPCRAAPHVRTISGARSVRRPGQRGHRWGTRIVRGVQGVRAGRDRGAARGAPGHGRDLPGRRRLARRSLSSSPDGCLGSTSTPLTLEPLSADNRVADWTLWYDSTHQ